ncbi:zf-HC2 domain-containing protein [Streptomyces sp. SCL15-4]|uniref:anti-sigma factor family protein n=1 Tax=Streptomyces sp. SCL15-4 TaxID=2967221 RepID=UPI0029665DF4|nr:zf-HC2 domain-containing protein [Streptomyces sp. SCL15-4]
MTSTTETAGHPDVAEISDLTEGLLAPDRDRDVRRHLDGCASCADVYASLEEIRDLLGSLPAPQRMPDDVTARLDAALAAEAALVAETTPAVGTEDTASHVSRETSPAAHQPAERPVDPAADRPAGRPRAATGPGRKGSGRGRRRGRFVLGAVLTAAVLGAGGLIVASLSDNTDHPSAHGTPTASAGTFSGDSVERQARSLLTAGKSLPQGDDGHRERPGDGSRSSGSVEGPNTLLQTAVPVPACVRQALRPSTDVLGAKMGTYAGRAAYLVVVTDVHDSERVTAYVVDASCVQRRTASAGAVLLRQSLARR